MRSHVSAGTRGHDERYRDNYYYLLTMVRVALTIVGPLP